jgi:hypothetical protein
MKRGWHCSVPADKDIARIIKEILQCLLSTVLNKFQYLFGDRAVATKGATVALFANHHFETERRGPNFSLAKVATGRNVIVL